ncbi:MAG TPA: SMP-30/gluconolactonase/LRE family protein [Acidimicrobiales bacterium]|nr:SMP-30/gluconolactonase/LRE family protein [Acidimicrobiales bacterium]
MKEYSATVVRGGLGFGESPRWHEGRLWYSDFYRRGVYSMAADGSDEILHHEVPTQPSGLGWLPDGDLLCASMTDQQILRFHGDEVSTFADISEHCGFWANDMVVATTGYSYVGNFGFDLDGRLAELGVERFLAEPAPTTNLVVLNIDGDVIQVVPDMAFPNGTVITPDGATLIVGETFGSRLTAFDVKSDGTLVNRRVWAPLERAASDGMCLDAEGQIWFANATTRQCVRVREGGEVTGTVHCTTRAFACMLGGEDRDTLFVMTSGSSDRFEIAEKTDACIEAVQVDVAGAGTP